jgi:hypothetical protein
MAAGTRWAQTGCAHGGLRATLNAVAPYGFHNQTNPCPGLSLRRSPCWAQAGAACALSLSVCPSGQPIPWGPVYATPAIRLPVQRSACPEQRAQSPPLAISLAHPGMALRPCPPCLAASFG